MYFFQKLLHVHVHVLYIVNWCKQQNGWAHSGRFHVHTATVYLSREYYNNIINLQLLCSSVSSSPAVLLLDMFFFHCWCLSLLIERVILMSENVDISKGLDGLLLLYLALLAEEGPILIECVYLGVINNGSEMGVVGTEYERLGLSP